MCLFLSDNVPVKPVKPVKSLTPVVVGHGSQSMLERVVGLSSVATNLRAVRISWNDKISFKKAENRYIRQFVRLLFSSHRFLTSTNLHLTLKKKKTKCKADRTADRLIKKYC